MAFEDVLEVLESTPEGLSSQVAAQRLEQHGKNVIEKPRSFRIGRLLWNQAKSPLAIVLLLAGAATLLLGEWLDAVVIATALLINAGLGIFQEGRASRVFDELTASLKHEVTVVRDGTQQRIARELVVPGDIIDFEGGKTVPADARLIEVFDLKVNESAFTGEWKPVKKQLEPVDEKVHDPDKRSMVWGGTIVASGAGRAVVVETGAATAFGRLASNVAQVDETQTPLTKSVERLARAMMVFIGCVLVLVILAGVFHGQTLGSMLLIAIAVAVAAMPEGMPAAVTVVLSVAMERVLRKGGLVKSLIAAETLGSTTIILTDKTGTLTEGNMQVAAVYSARALTQQDFSLEFADNRTVIEAAVLASDGFIEEVDGVPVVRGRPVERALVAAGMEAGITEVQLRALGYARKDFLHFESSRRYAGSLDVTPTGERYVFITGAPEKLVDTATHVAAAGGERKMTKADAEHFAHVQREGASKGQRFIGVARVKVDELSIPSDIEAGTPAHLTLLGIVALADTVRHDVPEEIARAMQSGARVVVVTGDYPETARAVACEAGIVEEGAAVLTGSEIEELTDAELYAKLMQISVIARVLPEQKLRIVRILRRHDHVVAMTGDGVNDAPALMAADIGVAVESGTDVAKAASDVILLKNTFSTIPAAIAEGRRAVDNLRKAILYLLSTSVTEVFIIAGSVLAGLPLPLLPTQLLWTNIIHEGFMSAPYAFEPGARDLMTRRPRGVDEAILTPHLRTFLMIISICGGITLFSFYLLLLATGFSIDMVHTLVFGALSLTALCYSLSLKDIHRPLWRISLFNNVPLLLGLGLSLGILALSYTLEPLRVLLSLEPLTLQGVAILGAFALVSIVAIELSKVLARALSGGQTHHA